MQHVAPVSMLRPVVAFQAFGPVLRGSTTDRASGSKASVEVSEIDSKFCHLTLVAKGPFGDVDMSDKTWIFDNGRAEMARLDFDQNISIHLQVDINKRLAVVTVTSRDETVTMRIRLAEAE